MQQAASGLVELYSRHGGCLNRFLLKLTRNPEEADDLVQEVFLRLCRQESLPEHPREWLFLTGYRLFVDQWRRKRRICWTPLDDSLPSHASPEQAVLDREFDRMVRRMLARLHPRTRTAFYLRIYKQLSYAEIARHLGCPENTVKSCFRRGKEQLARWL